MAKNIIKMNRVATGDFTYSIEDGHYILTSKSDKNKTYKQFYITAITPDCLEIYCYQNKRTCTLYRQ